MYNRLTNGAGFFDETKIARVSDFSSILRCSSLNHT